MTNTPVADLVADKITMTYRNYRGEVSERTITPLSIRWGVTEWHPVPGWLLTAFDHGKQADRDFALADCQFAALTPAGAEPVAWRIAWGVQKSGRKPLYMDAEPLYAHPQPLTVEAAEDIWKLANIGDPDDHKFLDALRALSGERS